MITDTIATTRSVLPNLKEVRVLISEVVLHTFFCAAGTTGSALNKEVSSFRKSLLERPRFHCTWTTWVRQFISQLMEVHKLGWGEWEKRQDTPASAYRITHPYNHRDTKEAQNAESPSRPGWDKWRVINNCQFYRKGQSETCPVLHVIHFK